MEDHTKRERQRQERDRRFQERQVREMERDLAERRRELERLQHSMGRELRDQEAEHYDISLDQGPDDIDDRDTTDSEFEDAEEQQEHVEKRSSFWSTLASGAASYLTPSFFKKVRCQ